MCEAPTEYDVATQEVVERPWQLPKNVSREIQLAAKAAIAGAVDDASSADQDTIRKWLAALGVLCAGQLTAADAKAKISIYAPMLNHHAVAAFTAGTLRDAGKKFKWFPSFSEIDEFLKPLSDRAVNLACRLDTLSHASEIYAHDRDNEPLASRPPMGKSWREMNPEERAQWEEWKSRGFGFLNKVPAHETD